ncbi:hypothetical protein NESM_000898200 [Novymonas esmeraldas]|uniref:Uncharacterized protein n=1 Tax=Novymonas esmeraldas TaxID=1808958 RepID=A0AAW0F239_9TRYP
MPRSPLGAVAPSRDVFADFTREWGGVLANDAAASPARLFTAYTAPPRSSRADGSGASATPHGSVSAPATVDDLLHVWAAAKGAGQECRAACMLHGLRRSIDGTVTQHHLMLSMLCWAATVWRQEHRFFKELSTPVRECIHSAALRCTGAVEVDDDAVALYESVAFCAALELLGWHDAMLLCLERAMSHPPPLRSEADVFWLLRRVAQELAPPCSSRGQSAESAPAITTTRTSAIRSSSERDASLVPAAAVVKVAAAQGQSAAVASADTDAASTAALLRRPPTKRAAHPVSRGRTEATRATGSAPGTPTPPPATRAPAASLAAASPVAPPPLPPTRRPASHTAARGPTAAPTHHHHPAAAAAPLQRMESAPPALSRRAEHRMSPAPQRTAASRTPAKAPPRWSGGA